MNGEANPLEENPHRGSLKQEGRHRRGDNGGWTPSVPIQPVRATGRRHELAEPPLDAPISGSLPLLPAVAPPRRESTSGFLPDNGELPFSRPALPDFDRPGFGRLQPDAPEYETSEFDSPEYDAPEYDDEDTVVENPVPRRKKVKLTAPPEPREKDDDVRVYTAPPVDGLGTFDLGSVPASVTPPKSWRKAAWFASLSSGGVVVALLCAGSFLVGAPGQNQAGLSWPGYRGGQPMMSGEQEAGPPGQNGAAAAAPSSGSRSTSPTGTGRPADDATSDTSTAGSGSATDPTSTATRATSPGTTRPTTPGTTAKPQKPPITSAPMQSQPVRFFQQMDPRAMGDTSQAFLNTVPGDAAAATELTTGSLHDQGPQALAQRYADVAYFEVKNVYIDQNEGYTINTVEVTHNDGTKSVERQTLTFGDDNKIASDGR